MSTTKIVTLSIISFLILAGGGLFVGLRLGSGPSSSGEVLGASQPGYKEFNVIMQNNRYNPSVLTVNEGDRVVINVTNNDNVGHGVGIAEFNARVPGDHVFPGQTARLDFVASRKVKVDAATCGGGPFQQTDAHGEELIINVI